MLPEGFSECVHETPGIREYEVQSSPLSWTVIRDMAQIEGFAVQGDGHVTLAVADTPPSVATGTITVPSPFAFYPSASVSASIHRCEGTDHGSCAICGHFPLTSVGATNVFFTIPVEGAEPTIPDVGHNPSQSFVFHNWVENPDYSIRDYAVLLHPVPGNTGASSSDMCGSWTKLSGPDSGTLLATNMVDLLLRRPTEGGIYRFRYEENASVGLGSVESEVILPLGGPDVTGYLYSEMQRYAAWATAVKSYINSMPGLDDFEKGSKLLAAFAKTAAAMNHKLGVYETANSPYQPLCNGTVTIGGHVLGKDQIGNILFAFTANRTGIDYSLTLFSGRAFALFTGTEEHPDDIQAYVMGYVLGYNPDADIQRILENRDLSIMQSGNAKVAWPSSETAEGATYPVYGLPPTSD